MIADEELQSFFNLSVDMLFVFNLDGDIVRINPAVTRSLGWSERELLCEKYAQYLHTNDLVSTASQFKTVGSDTSSCAFENRWRCANGTFRWLSWTARGGSDGKIYAIARDVTDQKHRDAKEKERYERLVQLDPLTGLLNRRGLEEALAQCQKQVHVILIDLDDFKNINTLCGHSAGDFALKDTAYMIRNAIRPADLAARIGGDEFMVVLSGLVWADSLNVAERIRGNIEIVKARSFEGSLLDVSASVGVLPLDADELSTTTEALQRVESLLKKAKTNGKNRVCFSEPAA